MVMTMVDARKFATGQYIRAADISGTVVKRIVNVAESDGKFGPKLDVWFEDSARMSLSGRNTGELMRCYGVETDLWLDKQVQLTVEDYEDRDGKPGKMIILTPIDPEVPHDQRPKLTVMSPPQEPLPPPKKGNGNTRGDMDDEIPF